MKNLGEKKSVGILLRCINKEIASIANKDLEIYGITLMQNEVLHYIYFKEKKQDINQKDIEKFFNCSNPTITGILNRLQAKSLVTREPSKEDARYKVIKLTGEGRHIVEKEHKVKAIQMEQRLIKNLSVDEAEQLEALLMKVLEGLKEE
ncbi:MAG: MarR family transcriptional regulator [Cellulosilyticum sp.]|nr:MarR family transcriptional regulator [Cellulosilyticum sp.]